MRDTDEDLWLCAFGVSVLAVAVIVFVLLAKQPEPDQVLPAPGEHSVLVESP